MRAPGLERRRGWRRRTGLMVAAFVAAGWQLVSGPALADTVKLATLEWPPYVIGDGSGTSTAAVASILARAGHTLETGVFPWNRAVHLAERDPLWLGVYPEYYSEGDDAEKGGSRCLYSKSFGVSPVGFVQPASKPISWATLDDLKAYRIGVVEGYVNEAQFDEMVARGDIRTDATTTDTLNIRKVAAGRIDAAVVDREVLVHLLSDGGELNDVASLVSFNDTLLAEHGLHVCFKNSDAGRALRDAFNAALQ